MYKNYYLLLALSAIMIGCKQKEMKIYELKQLSEYIDEEDVFKRSGITSKVSFKQFYVIANLPTKDPEVIFNIIQEFNKSTLNIDSIDADKIQLTRVFYHETDDIHKDFQPEKEGYFAKKDISFYHKDKIAYCSWSIESDKIYGFYIIYDNGNSVLNKQVREI